MDRRIEDTVLFLEKNVARNMTTADLARRVNLSTSRFIHLFKTQTLVSPKEYVRRLRLKLAEELLVGSFLSVKEIAARVGFGDRSHFSRDFKKYYGKTPSHWRVRKGLCRVAE